MSGSAGDALLGTVASAAESQDLSDGVPTGGAGGRLRRSRRPPAMLLAGCLLLAGGGFLPLTTPAPKILPDELAYLGVARFLGGAAALPDFDRLTFYQPTYGALVSPAYWLGAEPPPAAYRRVQAINAVLLGLLPLATWALLRGLGTGRRVAVWAALLCAAYPTYVVQCRFAMPEVAFVLAFVCMLALFARLLRRDTVPAGLAFGLAVIILPALHPRGVPVALLALGMLAAQFLRRRLRPGPSLAAAFALIAVWALVGRFDHWILAAGWSDDTRHSAAILLGKVGDPGSWGAAARALLGQLWYLSASTYGLAALGIGVVLQGLARRPVGHRGSRPRAARARRRGVLALLALAVAGILTVSVLHMTPGGPGQGYLDFVDARLYGRYDEGFLAPLLALGVVSLVAAGGARRLAWSVAALCACGLALRLAWGSAPLAGQVIFDNVLGLAPFLGDGRFCIGLFGIGAVAALCGGAIAATRRVLWRAALWGLGALFAVGAARGIALTEAAAELPARVPELLRALHAATVGYDRAVLAPRFYALYQYEVPTLRFVPYDSRRGEVPASPTVLSDALPEHHVGQTYLWSEFGQTLWTSAGAPPATLFDPDRMVVGVDPEAGVWRDGFGPLRLTANGAEADIAGLARLRVAMPPSARVGALELALSSTFPAPVDIAVRVAGAPEQERVLTPGGAVLAFDVPPLAPGEPLALEITAPPSGAQRVGFRWLAVGPVAAEPAAPAPGAPAPRGRIERGGRFDGAGLRLGCDEVQVIALALRAEGGGVWPGAAAGGGLGIAWRLGDRVVASRRFAVPRAVQPGGSLALNLPLTTRGLAAGQYELEVRALAGDRPLPDIAPLLLPVQVGSRWPLCDCAR